MGGLSAARWRWAARMVHRRRQVGMAGSIGCRAIHLLGVSLDPSGQLAGRSGRPPRGGSSGWREETPREALRAVQPSPWPARWDDTRRAAPSHQPGHCADLLQPAAAWLPGGRDRAPGIARHPLGAPSLHSPLRRSTTRRRCCRLHLGVAAALTQLSLPVLCAGPAPLCSGQSHHRHARGAGE